MLSLLGTQPSVFQDALVSVSSQIPVVEHEAFETAFSSTVLGEVQRGLMFNEPAASMADFAADDSVQFHQCTGIGREVDAMVAGVLHQIMDSGVAPSDVVVMAPDINEYAPWIEAAMMNTGVPFSISDRSVSTSPGASEATEILLQLMTSRLTVQEVFTLLEMVPVAARFSLDETDVRTAWKWCTDARIRSCIDATHRQHLGLEPFWENTWRFGLNRLLLGIAIDSDDSLFAGVSPLPAYVGTDTAKLGRLLTYLETLFALVEACRQPRSVSDWCALWDDQLGEFLTPTTDGFATVRSVFQRLAEQSAISGFDTDIDFAAFRTLLKGRIARARFTSGSGYGVRFSSFRFLRGDSVPIVALLGMDEGKFPLDARAPSFDIIAAKPQPGDKDMRHEGYHMFLEAVMAASRQLLVVYGGTSETTGQTVKPCVPVRQLLASVRDIVACAGQNADTPPIHLCHPVHAHASVYFEPDSPAFVNYQRNDFQAALAARQQNASNHGARHSVISATKSAQEVFARPSEIPDAGVTLALNDFFRFWKNPPLHYLANSLGLAFMAPEELVPDDEPVHLAGLDEWHVGQRFVEALLRRKDWTEVLKVVRALGIAPSGSLGEFYAGRVYDQAKRISHAVVNRQVVDTREEVAVDVTVDSALGPLRLLGTMPLYDGAVFEYRYGRVRDEIKIKLMLQYLVARTLEEKALEKVTNRPATIIGRGKDKFHPVYCELEMEMTEVRSLLSRISGWTILGLTKPLVFSAADGFAFAKRSSKLSPHAKDLLLQQTISTMTQMMQQQAPPEARALLDTGIIQQGCDEFGQIVASVVSPLLSHLKEGRL